MSSPRWLLPPDDPGLRSVIGRFESELKVPSAMAGMLVRRGFRTSEAVQRFLHPKLNLLSDPFSLPNMPAAVDRITRALDDHERIVLYGDYDVDGVTSLAIFSELLKAYGADVHCFLPKRIEEGYGLNAEGLARCMETLQPRLLIAVDCGTASAGEIAMLQGQGIDTLVFDHHEPQTVLPVCAGLVNPQLGDAFHYLCSAGLVFKACHALLKRRPLPDFDLKSTLDLVALGTVADLVPLVEENRILVRRGALEMAQTARIGLRALMDVAGVTGPVRPSDIGYRLGPRLNAAGRLGTAQAALELLITDDPVRAQALAAALDERNRERQAVEQSTLTAAQHQFKSHCTEDGKPRHAAIVVGARGWHPGVLGIVASRLVRTHHRPALVVGFDDHGVGKGSGRSIEGLSLVNTLTDCARLLDRFGGHAMAAGLTIQESVFEEFQQAFCQAARATLSDEQLEPFLRLDAEVSLADLDRDFLSAHESLQPFGMGNPQPTFVARGVAPVDEPRILKDKHRKLLLRSAGKRAAGGYGTAVPAIWFNSAHLKLPPVPWDVAFQIEANEFRGSVTLQMQVQAVRAAE